MVQCALKNVNNCLTSNIYSYLETSGGQRYCLYLDAVHFLTPVLIRHLWHLKTVVFLHWGLIRTVLLSTKKIWAPDHQTAEATAGDLGFASPGQSVSLEPFLIFPRGCCCPVTRAWPSLKENKPFFRHQRFSKIS
jgi:hypothetical protein